MARLDVSGMDELIAQLEKYGDEAELNAAAMRAVNAGAPIVAGEMAVAIRSVEHGPYATGSVSDSIEATTAKTNAYGVFSVAKPTGRDKKGLRNAEKAAYLQYGTPTMAARPWAERSARAAVARATPIVKETFLRAMGIDTGGEG